MKTGGQRRTKFVDGWIEFHEKKRAKRCADLLNGQQIGGKKRKNAYREDVWCIKYLHKFKWDDIKAQERYDFQVRKKRFDAKMAQSRRESNFLVEQMEESKKWKKMVEKKNAKKGSSKSVVVVDDDDDVDKLAGDNNQASSSSSSSSSKAPTPMKKEGKKPDSKKGEGKKGKKGKGKKGEGKKRSRDADDDIDSSSKRQKTDNGSSGSGNLDSLMSLL